MRSIEISDTPNYADPSPDSDIRVTASPKIARTARAFFDAASGRIRAWACHADIDDMAKEAESCGWWPNVHELAMPVDLATAMFLFLPDELVKPVFLDLSRVLMREKPDPSCPFGLSHSLVWNEYGEARLVFAVAAEDLGTGDIEVRAWWVYRDKEYLVFREKAAGFGDATVKILADRTALERPGRSVRAAR